MELFENHIDSTKNLLPCDGEVYYYGSVLTHQQADAYFNEFFNNIEWRHDEATYFGKHYVTKRKVAWYGEKDFEYTYSNNTKRALPWTPKLLGLKQKVEEITQETYNSCLLNLYHSGEEGMAWHSDGESDLKKHGAIASVSLGAERKFGFKHKNSKETIWLPLAHGSLLVMKGTTQDYWMHRLPTTKKINTARVNLTFRTIVNY